MDDELLIRLLNDKLLNDVPLIHIIKVLVAITTNDDECNRSRIK